MTDEKITIDGKRFTRRERTTIDQGSLLDYARKHGRDNGKGGLVIGQSFRERLQSLHDTAVKFLKQQNLPYSPMIYKVTSEPKEWVDSDAPEDIENNLGKKLKDGIRISWEMDMPPQERSLGNETLDKHITRLGYDRDSFEDLAARIITEFFYLQECAPTEESRLGKAFELGRLSMTAQVYSLESLANQKNAKKDRKKTWAVELAENLKRSHKTFKKAWNSIPDDDDYSDVLSVRKTTKDGKEGIEYLDVTPPDFLTKDSFRTGYFSKQ